MTNISLRVGPTKDLYSDRPIPRNRYIRWLVSTKSQKLRCSYDHYTRGTMSLAREKPVFSTKRSFRTSSWVSLNWSLEQLFFSLVRICCEYKERCAISISILQSPTKLGFFFCLKSYASSSVLILNRNRYKRRNLAKVKPIRCFLKPSWDFISPYVRSISNGCILFCSRILSDAVVAGSAV